MKKIILMFFIGFLFVLGGCGSKVTTEAETTGNKPVSFKVITPAGSPALAQTYIEKMKPSLGKEISYEIEVVTDATKLASGFASKTYEFIFAPMNMGVKMYNAAGQYQLAATVVFGNNYIATTSDEEISLSSLQGKDIILFGEGNVPAIVCNELLVYNNITPKSVSYVAATSDSMNQLVLDKTKIVLIAEPSLSALKVKLAASGVTNLKTINLTSEWKKMTGNDSYPQAGVFVKKEFAQSNSEVVKSYLSQLSESVTYANTHVDEVAQMAVDLGYGFPLPVLKSAIPNSNLLFKNASDSKSSVEYLCNKIIASNGALIGNKVPDEGFYFK